MAKDITRVLVTGGAGFIGSHTVDLLVENDIRVCVLDNLSTGRTDNLDLANPRLEFIEGDILDSETLEQAFNGVSHCLHLAAQVSVQASIENPAVSATQNILGFVKVLEAARKHGIKRFVYASSAAVYGHPRSVPVAENSDRSPLSPYGLEKATNEDYASLFSELYGISCLGQRYFNVYGPRQDPRSPYAGVIALFADRIAKQAPVQVFGDGEQTRDFIFVHDVARANLAALQSNLAGTCNIGTARQTSLLQMLDALCRLTGKTSVVVFRPPREGDIRHSLAEVRKMNDELGFVAETTIEQGLADLLAC